ncbi:ALQxL family class IV lanthipeptide [Streptomyces sp. NPDC059828]
MAFSLDLDALQELPPEEELAGCCKRTCCCEQTCCVTSP